MTRYNFTLDDPSPLLNYAPTSAWQPATDLTQYMSSGTQTQTSQINATMQWTFSGTGIWVYGSKQYNHGSYTVKLDDRDPQTFDGYSDADQWKVPLFAASDLDMDSHTITITNVGPSSSSNPERVYFALDYIQWESNLGSSHASVSDMIYDDKASNFHYLPTPNTWVSTKSNNQSDDHYGGTVTRTTDSNAVMEFAFTGVAVALFSAVDPKYGNYTAQVDSGKKTMYTSYAPINQKQQLLYFEDGLESGSHTLRVQVVPINSTLNGWSVDYGQVWTVAGGHGGSPSIGVIAGGVIAGVLAIIAALSFFMFFRHRRRKPREMTLETDLLGTDIHESYVSPYEHQSLLGDSSGGYTDMGHHRTPDAISWDSGSGSMVLQPLYAPRRPYKAAAGIVPLSQQSEDQIKMSKMSPEELREHRWVVPGRAQDFGPVILGVDEEGGELPPDYRQALQPPVGVGSASFGHEGERGPSQSPEPSRSVSPTEPPAAHEGRQSESNPDLTPTRQPTRRVRGPRPVSKLGSDHE